MDTERRHHLQDIYATDQKKNDDFTPQVSNEIIEERKRDQRRHQFVSFVMGSTILLMAVALIVLIAREYMQRAFIKPTQTPISGVYIPRYSLDSEDQWVLDLNRSYGDPEIDDKEDRPFNTTWLKKAAYNIVMAEQAMEIAKTDKKSYEQAVRFYEQALAIVPDLDGVKVPLGMAYFEIGDFETAKEVLESVGEDKLTPDTLNNLGIASIKSKEYEQAEDYIKRSLDMAPTYKQALKNLALLYKEMDDRVEDAIAAYQQYLDQNSIDVNMRFDFSVYLVGNGKWETAAQQLRILAEMLKDDQMVYLLLARAESNLGNAEAAMAALRRGVQLSDPSNFLSSMNDDDFDRLRNTEEFQDMIRSLQKR